MMYGPAIGEVVLRRRKALGKSQRWVAETAGVAINTVHYLERGICKDYRSRNLCDPRLETIASIAGALGCRLSELIAEVEDRNVNGYGAR